MARRGANEGSIFCRKDGRWVAQIDTGWRDGKRRLKSCYFQTQAAAIEALPELRKRYGCLDAEELSTATLAEYAGRWLTQIALEDIKARTVKSYKQLLNLYVLPTLGRKKLVDVRSQDIRALVRTLYSRSLGRNTVRLARAAVSALYSDAVAEGLIPSNPVLAARAGRRRLTNASDPTASIRPFTDDDLTRLLSAADADLYPLLLISVRAGLRPGEAVALQWADIDFSRRELLIERAVSDRKIGSPKTGKARRVDISLELATELRKLQVQREKEKLAGRWQEMPIWVFVNSAGGILDQARTSRRFQAIMRRAELSGHVLYDLRHTYATQLLARNAPITYVANQMGHSSPSTTLKWYARWIPRDGCKTYVDALDAGDDGATPSPSVGRIIR